MAKSAKELRHKLAQIAFDTIEKANLDDGETREHHVAWVTQTEATARIVSDVGAARYFKVKVSEIL